ncbi:MAG: aminodeoxychorismate/anthranilate synthase component II [Kangiellaceae bacterium]|jgi:anthranilate synthase component 2|nr:aminodeoxychorismate/anthranilate synthase component II [Kangiellaceae bacterium]
MAKLLMIDNYDSFTYNLVDELKLLSHQVTVVRNSLSLATLKQLASEHDVVVISPGPSSPNEAGQCLALLEDEAMNVPILGICLGHQIICQSAGATITRAPQPVHGKATDMTHNSQACFETLPNPIRIARYHSLVAKDLPSSLAVIATSGEQVMAVYQANKNRLGLQFHPESILTTYGSLLLQRAVNFLLNSNFEGARR